TQRPEPTPAPARPAQKGEAARERMSICVLPFANMSGDAEQEYFSDGISEDIITDLSKVSALHVISRNTAFTFKGKPVDVRQVAGQLNVSHVLEGSVRKAAGRVRITAQLIDGSSDSHVWAERYDRDLNDIFALQDEISRAIVDALKVKLLRATFDRGGDGGLAAAERALELNADLAEAHAVKARILSEEKRHDEASREIEIAVRLDPESQQVNKCAGVLRFRQQRLKESIRYFEKAVALEEGDFGS